ncbi:MAG TPA: hypothetical protein VLJ39_16315, partial [Tepidisphaeraceae bacterium]|nr:hypothetical protein [Tepidisphaeraceae bacterium]
MGRKASRQKSDLLSITPMIPTGGSMADALYHEYRSAPARVGPLEMKTWDAVNSTWSFLPAFASSFINRRSERRRAGRQTETGGR